MRAIAFIMSREPICDLGISYDTAAYEFNMAASICLAIAGAWWTVRKLTRRKQPSSYMFEVFAGLGVVSATYLGIQFLLPAIGLLER